MCWVSSAVLSHSGHGISGYPLAILIMQLAAQANIAAIKMETESRGKWLAQAQKLESISHQIQHPRTESLPSLAESEKTRKKLTELVTEMKALFEAIPQTKKHLFTVLSNRLEKVLLELGGGQKDSQRRV